VWGYPVPCVERVADPYSREAPGAVWDCALSADDIAERLAETGIPVAGITGINVAERSDDGRIARLAIQHAAGILYLSGNSFRLMLGPGRVKGTDFEVQRQDGSFALRGRGYGHGAGMSQWGARAMARGGRDYAAILAWYYPAARMRDMHAP
jgi:stage II sporulation protein D